MRAFVILLLLLTLGASGFYIYRYFEKKIETHRVSRVATHAPTAPSKPTVIALAAPPTPVPPSANLHVPQNEKCKGSSPETKLAIPLSDLDKLRKGLTIKVIYAPDALCFKTGPISSGPRLKLKMGFALNYALPDEIVNITDISEIPLTQINFAEVSDVAYRDPEAPDQPAGLVTKFHDEGYPSTALFVVLTIKFDKSLSRADHYVTTKLYGLNFAELIEPAKINDLVNHGATVVDIRQPGAFRRAHFSAAINAPYTADPCCLANKTLYRQFSARDKFVIPSQVDSTKSVIVIGESAQKEILAVRAAVMLSLAGFKNIAILAGGEAAREGIDERTSKSIVGISIIGAPMAKILLGKHAKFFGILGPDAAAEYGHISGDLLSYRDLSEFPRRLTLIELVARGDSFAVQKLPKNKNVSIIFYGTSETDWAPLKAAIWARDTNYKNVYYFRDGMAKWPGPFEEAH